MPMPMPMLTWCWLNAASDSDSDSDDATHTPHTTPHRAVGSQVAINRDTLSGRRDNVYKVGKATGRLLMDAAIDAVNQKQKTTTAK